MEIDDLLKQHDLQMAPCEDKFIAFVYKKSGELAFKISFKEMNDNASRERGFRLISKKISEIKNDKG